MPDHYYTPAPQSDHDLRQFALSAGGRTLQVQTDSGVFSREHLDPGSALLLRALPPDMAGEVLDLGCGWGAMGLILAATRPGVRLTLSDVNARALDLCRGNFDRNHLAGRFLLSDGFAGIEARFDWIITNPPIRAGKQVVYGLFAGAARHLAPGGRLMVVIRRQQGAPSALSHLQTLFSDARMVMRDKGYWIIQASGPINLPQEDMDHGF